MAQKGVHPSDGEDPPLRPAFLGEEEIYGRTGSNDLRNDDEVV